MLSSFLGGALPAQVYIACGATDMRKSIDGLAAIVAHTFALDPCSPGLFVFCNGERNKLKILFWEHNGFWLFYRRLEKGRFRWPATSGEQPMTIDQRQLQWLLAGLELEQRGAHAALGARRVA